MYVYKSLTENQDVTVQLLPNWEHEISVHFIPVCLNMTHKDKVSLNHSHFTQPHLIHTYYHSLILGCTHKQSHNLYTSWS